MIGPLTRLVLNIVRESFWFLGTLLGGAVAGFLLFLMILVPPLTRADLSVIRGPLETYATTAAGNFAIRMRGDPQVFEITSSDMPFFAERQFRQDLHVGAPLTLMVVPRGPTAATIRPQVVLELQSGRSTYLALQPVLTARQQERTVIFPSVIVVAVLLAGGTFLLGRRYQQGRQLASTSCQ
jgi:hypothetical protein